MTASILGWQDIRTDHAVLYTTIGILTAGQHVDIVYHCREIEDCLLLT